VEISLDTSVGPVSIEPAIPPVKSSSPFPMRKGRILFPRRGPMPAARKVVTRSPHRRVGRIACPWFQPTAIEYESLLERDFIRLALLDLSITSIAHQPFSLDLGELGTYVPDFLLIGQDKKLVVEVKPKVHATTARNQPRLARARQILHERGHQFVVATEQTIQAQGLHRRAGVLLRHARGQISPTVSAKVIQVVSRYPDGVSLGRVASDAETPIHMVLHLVGRRLVRINASLNLCESDFVYPLGADHVHLYT